MDEAPEPIERLAFEAQRLMEEHPPMWRDRNKREVYSIACPIGCTHTGQLVYSRWRPMPLPVSVDVGVAFRRVEGREDVYDYAPTLGTDDSMDWHVNFADPHLFVAYGSSLFAQDEMQVAEHPVLGALKEALEAEGHEHMTVDDGQPTPVLVLGAERRCRVSTDRNAEEGRPRGLYGNAFARANPEVVRRATTRIDPPTFTNFVAIAAPSGGLGRYTMAEIDLILTTAFTGFRAAVLESQRHQGRRCPVVAHTGFWGCGAFGGNRVLMATLQVLAAEMAELNHLVFHTFDGAGTDALDAAGALIEADLTSGSAVDTLDLLQQLEADGFEWGESDGN